MYRDGYITAIADDWAYRSTRSNPTFAAISMKSASRCCAAEVISDRAARSKVLSDPAAVRVGTTNVAKVIDGKEDRKHDVYGPKPDPRYHTALSWRTGW